MSDQLTSVYLSNAQLVSGSNQLTQLCPWSCDDGEGDDGEGVKWINPAAKKR